MTTYMVNVREIPLKLIKNREKTIELRINKGIFEYGKLKIEDSIWFYHHTEPHKYCEKTIINIKRYDTFKECLESNINKLHEINPLSNSIEESLDIYLKPNGIYTKENEFKYGVVAFFVE
jgi:ASC-1-like (ASCH) protein